MRMRGAGATAMVAAAILASGCSTKSSSSSSNSGGGGASSGSSKQVKTGQGISGTTLSLGVLTDQTGVFAALGKDVTAGQQLYWDQQNAKGGVCNKYKVTLKIADHGYNVQKAVQQYAQLSSQVLAFQQLLGSPMNTALTTKIQSDKITTIPESWAANLTDNPYNTIVGATYAVEMVNGIDFLLKQGLIKQGDTVGHIYHESEYGANGFAGSSFMQKQGKIKVVGQQVTALADVTSAVNALARAKVKAILLTDTPTQTATVAGVAAAQGLDVPILGNNPTYSPALLKTPAGPALLKHFYAASPVVSYDNSAVGTLRDDIVKKTGNQNPSLGAVHGYATAKVMDEILEKACTNGDLTRDGVYAAKKSLTSLDTGGLVPPLDYSKAGVSPAIQSNILQAASVPGGAKTVAALFQGDDAKSYKR